MSLVGDKATAPHGFVGWLADEWGNTHRGKNDAEDIIGETRYYAHLMLEYSDNLAQAISKIEWKKVFKQAVTEAKKFIEMVPQLALAAATGLIKVDPRYIAYLEGYIAFNIIICIIPVVDLIQLTSIAKLATPIQELFEVFLKLVKGTGKFAVQKIGDLFTLFEDFINLLRKGTKEVGNFIKKVFEAIQKWLEELLGIKKKVEDIADLATEELDWMASRKTGALGGKVLKQTQIRQLRGTLTKKNIQLIVDGDVKSITKLFVPTKGFKTVEDLFFFMKMQDPPFVGMFNAETKQFFLSKEATEIVAFHEMAHVKHFEEVGEIAYKTYTKLEKEMYVWKQIFSQKQRWTLIELKDALRYINDIRVNPKYGYKLDPLNIKL